MIPPRPVVASWRALEAADLLCAEFDRHIEDLETLSATVRDTCHRLDGDGWQGLAYDAVLAHVDAAHRRHQRLCEQAEQLRDAGARALSELHYTTAALLDYVADAEAAGCRVADNWAVTAGAAAQEWSEVITEAVAAVERADECGRMAIGAITTEINHLATSFDLPGMLLTGLSALTAPSCPGAGSQSPHECHCPQTAAESDSTREEHNSQPNECGGSGKSGEDGSSREPREDDDLRESGEEGSARQVSDEDAVPEGPGNEEGPQTETSAAALIPADGQQQSAVSTAQGGAGPLSAPTIPAAAVAGHGEIETGSAAGNFVPLLPPAVIDPPPGGVSVEQLVAIMPDLSAELAGEYLPALNAAMREGDITTPPRQAAFLAQLAHESCQLRYFEELGDDDYFSQYDPGRPNTAAGNTEPGDGPRYHGRGPIQLTGRANYREAGAALGLDLEANPELAAQPDIGFRIAQWYWTSRNINALADADDFAAVTRAVNGGYNGLAARQEYYARALEVLG
ncbi:glycoside hydrolase family 19 protein [Nocardia wallacei]|uniref:Glycoside hydrolase family 19 catalytic domain-containing protein n=1 Tax=Nocardia wallacei TaxID=480035 RepID=A0A7G1KTC2_9NOCA|nr:glycoside hydrolase family 19 protein [Nocardia wallacei]BCK58485.1 hypothetical protein NWFMUON74_62570 [Nocardia wallacei]